MTTRAMGPQTCTNCHHLRGDHKGISGPLERDGACLGCMDCQGNRSYSHEYIPCKCTKFQGR